MSKSNTIKIDVKVRKINIQAEVHVYTGTVYREHALLLREKRKKQRNKAPQRERQRNKQRENQRLDIGSHSNAVHISSPDYRKTHLIAQGIGAIKMIIT